MAIRWNFETDKMGIIEYEGGKALHIYNGNAYAIFLYEYTQGGEDMYSLHCFYANKEHAKRCLALTKDTKGNDICFPDSLSWGDDVHKMTKIVLDPRARNAKELAQLLIKAYNNITIELKEV